MVKEVCFLETAFVLSSGSDGYCVSCFCASLIEKTETLQTFSFAKESILQM